MKFLNQRVTVTGSFPSKGVLESGAPYDSTKVFVLTDLDDSKGVGTATVEYKWGTSENYQKIASFIKAACDAGKPALFDADLEVTTNGKTQRTQVVDLRPVASVKAG